MDSDKFQVVISGMSGKFPACDSVPEFKEKLYAKEDFISFDNRKWPIGYKYKFSEEIVPSGTGKYNYTNRIDARVFYLNHVLANGSCPINRQVLESAFEAICDAGVNPASLSGTQTGVFMSCAISEAESFKALTADANKDTDSRLFLLGASKTMLSNRISYSFNLKGPSYTTYSTWEGGMEGLYEAYSQISKGLIEAAIVGAASSITDPKLSLSFVRLGVLSPDSMTRAFDKNANGYGRSEAGVILFLQRSDVCKRIYGILLYADTYYIGSHTDPVIGYKPKTVAESLRVIYDRCKSVVKPSDIFYLEMNADGVPRFDKIECESVVDVFCEGGRQLYVGSAKSNVGHCEGSSGLVSVVKALLALDSGIIAANLHYENPNPNIEPLISGQLKVISDHLKLEKPIVAVNAIGMTGIVGHAIFRQHSKPKSDEVKYDKDKQIPYLVVMYGRTENGLRNSLKKIESMPLNRELIWIANDVFSVPLQTHLFRSYTMLPVLSSKPENSIEALNTERRPVWLVFSGMGSQWNGMGAQLLRIPLFARAIEKCDIVLKPLGVDIYHVLTSKEPNLFENLTNCFVGIAAVQVGLVEILRAIGVEADGLIGHSLGENACAFADGCLTLEQTILSAYARAMASIQTESVKGMMAAVGVGFQQMRNMVPEGIEVACHNSAENCTLTGPADIVVKYVEQLRKDGIFAKAINVSNKAYHSKHIAPAAPLLFKYVKEVIPTPKLRSSKWVSTSVAESAWSSDLAKWSSAEYQTNNLISPVLFEEGCTHIPDNAILIEIAPHGLLQSILKRSLGTRNCTSFSLTMRSDTVDSAEYLLNTLGRLYQCGMNMNINALYPPVEFPVPRETPSIVPFLTWDHSEEWGTIEPLKDPPLSEEVLIVRANKGTEFHYLNGHKVNDEIIIPGAFYLYLAWKILANVKNEVVAQTSIVFENIRIHQHLTLSLEKPVPVTVMIQYGSGSFEVLLEGDTEFAEPSLVASGQIIVPYDKLPSCGAIPSLTEKHRSYVKDQVYRRFASYGYQLMPPFDAINSIKYDDEDCTGKVVWKENWCAFLDSVLKSHLFTELHHSDKSTPVLQRIQRLAISSQELKQLESGTEVEFHKDLMTKRWRCAGVEMTGVVWTNLKDDKVESLSAHANLVPLQFMPYENPTINDWNSFASFAIQLAYENVATMTGAPDGKLYLLDSTEEKALASLAKSLCDVIPQLKSKLVVKNWNVDGAAPNGCYLATANELSQLNYLVSSLRHVFVLITLPSDHEALNGSIPHSVIVVAKLVVSKHPQHVLLLLKKNENAQDKSQSLVIEESKLGNAETQECSSSVVIFDQKNPPSLSSLVPVSMKADSRRFIYVSDENAPSLAADNSFYREQLSYGLAVNVLKQKKWGSYKAILEQRESTLPFNMEENKHLTNKVDCPRIKGIEVKYYAIEFTNYSDRKFTDSELQSCENKTYSLEYSGINKNGKRVMGIAHRDALNSGWEVDPHLCWTVPDGWTLEEAATVPHLYSMAFYLMVSSHRANCINIESVLVHKADTPLGEAIVSIMLGQKLTVYATVCDVTKSSPILRKRFPSLDPAHIMSNAGTEYETKVLLLTRGKGVDLVINSMTGVNHQDASLNCVALSGCYVETHPENCASNDQMGLFTFLKSVSLYVIHDYAAISQSASNVKREIYELVANGIASGVVKPSSNFKISNIANANPDESEHIKRISVHNWEAGDSTQCVEKERKMKPSLHCDSDHSFLIIGGKKPTLWLDVVEWLAIGGARKFIVAVDNFSLGASVSHRMNKLISRHGATIVMTTTHRADSQTEAEKLVTEASKLAQLNAVFFICTEKSQSRVRHLDLATRSKGVLFVGIHYGDKGCGGLATFEARRNAGLQSMLIHSDKPLQKLSTLLPKLGQLFNNADDTASPTLYLFAQADSSSQVKSWRGEDVVTIGEYLPVGEPQEAIRVLKQIGETIAHVGKEATFREVTTLSPHYRHTKGVTPIFFVPAIDGALLQPLTSGLFYPAFCAHLPETLPDISKLVAQLTQEVRLIQKEGNVTLVGEGWSGCIAIEMAANLVASGTKVRLFLMEGSPVAWKINAHRVNLMLKDLLRLTKLSTDQNNNLKDWDRLLESAFTLDDAPAGDAIKVCANSLRNRLTMSSAYAPADDLLDLVTHFNRKNFPAKVSLEQYCRSNEVVIMEDEKYSDFLRNPQLLHYINDNALITLSTYT